MSHEHGSPPPRQVIMQMTMGMWVAQLVGTAARLGVADLIAAGTTSSDAVADALHANRDATYRLLRAMASVGVLAQKGREFTLTAVGELLKSGPGSMRDFIAAETAPGHWLPWGRFENAVRTGKPQTFATLGTDAWSYYSEHPDEAASFSRAMAGLSAFAGGAVLEQFDVRPFRKIVDIGGAYGDFLAQALAINTTATGIVFDLPHVVDGARQSLTDQGLAARVDVAGGSFFDSVPSGGDLYLLKQILHGWSDDECVRILGRVRQAMGAQGTLLVVEYLVPDDGSPSPAPLLDLDMMVMLTGRERTAAEFSSLLAKAGLALERVVKTESAAGALVAVAA